MVEPPAPSARTGDDIAVASALEAGLVGRARAGDAEAFGALVAPHLDQAAGTARRLMRTQEDAEDLVQQACLRAIEQLDRFQLGRPFGPWFHRLLTNLGLNQLKSARVRQAAPLDEHQPASTDDPLQQVEDAEIRRRFADAVNALSPRQRLIVFRFDVDGCSGAEIAEELGISAQTVRWHLHEARATLRRRLADLRPSPSSEE